MHSDPYFCPMESTLEAVSAQDMLSFEAFRNSVIADYKLAIMSREVSLLGRREVLTGKAKFGIFGDGKEVAQIALSKFFQKGDFRSGYYRDQTFMFALGVANVEDYFSQLYSDVYNDPFSGGKNMNAHFATAFVNEKGDCNELTQSYNVSADIAPTAGQMMRGLGLAFASNCFRNAKNKEAFQHLSNNGNEVCFCTIDAKLCILGIGGACEGLAVCRSASWCRWWRITGDFNAGSAAPCLHICVT